MCELGGALRTAGELERARGGVHGSARRGGRGRRAAARAARRPRQARRRLFIDPEMPARTSCSNVQLAAIPELEERGRRPRRSAGPGSTWLHVDGPYRCRYAAAERQRGRRSSTTGARAGRSRPASGIARRRARHTARRRSRRRSRPAMDLLGRRRPGRAGERPPVPRRTRGDARRLRPRTRLSSPRDAQIARATWASRRRPRSAAERRRPRPSSRRATAVGAGGARARARRPAPARRAMPTWRPAPPQLADVLYRRGRFEERCAGEAAARRVARRRRRDRVALALRAARLAAREGSFDRADELSLRGPADLRRDRRPQHHAAECLLDRAEVLLAGRPSAPSPRRRSGKHCACSSRRRTSSRAEQARALLAETTESP